MADKDAGRWQIGKSLIECHRYRLEQQIDCDVTFKLTNPETTHVGAHKYMLATRSPVFEAMFSGNFKEVPEVIITDVESAAFKEMLRYIYTDEVNMCADNALHVLAAAKKYLLDGLEDICTAFLEDNICKDNACMLLDQSNLFGTEKLKKKCLHLIAKETQAVFGTDDFLRVSQSGLLEILKQVELNVETESAVYTACITWAKTKSGKQTTDIELREILGPCLYQIRFCSMKAEEFANTAGRSSILNSDEKSAFYSFILTKTNPGQLKEWGFNLKWRRPDTGFCKIFESFQKIDHQVRNKSWKQSSIRIEVDSTIHMIGVTVLGCTKGGQYDLAFVISPQQSPQQMMFGRQGYTTEQPLRLKKCITAIDNSQHLTFSLDEAYKLIPGDIYQIYISVKNHQNPMYQACNPKHNVHVQGVNFKLNPSGFGYSETNNFITGICFKKPSSIESL